MNALNDLGKGRRLGFLAGLVLAGMALLCFAATAQDPEPAREGVVLTLDGAVTPAAAQYLSREIAAASDAGKELVLIEVDTPGGLMDSMKTIIKAILASETPVVTYVYPQGARSASAGLYIMYAAHVSAMAPSTNTGAATPVEIGGPGGEQPTPKDQPKDEKSEKPELPAPLANNDALRAKAINDAVAYIRALAEERGRNAEWAESAVREAVSVPAREALELGVVDVIADNVDSLLQQIDGKTVNVASGEKVLHTKNLTLTEVEPSLVEKILAFLSNPNVAVILMSLGTTGIIIEMWNPGAILPGIIGLACLILGLYSFQVLPHNWLGLALMGAGALFMIVEAYTPTLGLVGLAGLALFGFGLFVVFPGSFQVSPAVISSVLVFGAVFLGLILFAVVGSRSHGPLIGAEAIRRREGVVDDWDGKEGHVIVEGERWRARADKPLQKGDRVRVLEVDGLVLVVKQAKAPSLLGGLMPGEA